MFHSGGKRKKNSFDLIFIMYMINYYIAPDYQKIVRDIIFHMYLISVHVETCALEGPNAQLFFFFFMGEISITRLHWKWQWGRHTEEVIRAASIGLRRCFSFTDEKDSQSNNRMDPPPTHAHTTPTPSSNTTPIYHIYISLINTHLHRVILFTLSLVSLFTTCLMSLSGGSSH